MRILTQPLKFFKEFNKRRKKQDQITYEEYLELDKKVALDSSGKPNPLKQRSLDRKIETFGESILTESKLCECCGRRQPLSEFPVRWDQNNHIGRICIPCESERKSKYT